VNTTPPPEVRPYLIKLVSLIVLAIALMTSVATWAWNQYGKRLADRPPLPSGAPPVGTAAPAWRETRPGPREVGRPISPP